MNEERRNCGNRLFPEVWVSVCVWLVSPSGASHPIVIGGKYLCASVEDCIVPAKWHLLDYLIVRRAILPQCKLERADVYAVIFDYRCADSLSLSASMEVLPPFTHLLQYSWSIKVSRSSFPFIHHLSSSLLGYIKSWTQAHFYIWMSHDLAF